MNNCMRTIALALALLSVLSEAAERDWAAELYNLSMARYLLRNSHLKRGNHEMKALHLLRIPKASSTSFSAVVRRLAGCVHPPGPCCKFPGTPRGSCPSEELFACSSEAGGPVIGCVGHNPNYKHLLDRSIPSVSFIREPISRSLSAFYYPGEHHNSECDGKASQMVCFSRYVNDKKYSNVAVKILNGVAPYANVNTCIGTAPTKTFSLAPKDCKHTLWTAVENINRLNFVGIAEMWELSIALLYEVFPEFKPNIDDFRMNLRSQSSSTSGIKLLPGSLSYEKFRDRVISETNLQRKLVRQNYLDSIVYHKAIHSFKRKLRSTGLLKASNIVTEYLEEHLSVNNTGRMWGAAGKKKIIEGHKKMSGILMKMKEKNFPIVGN